MKYFPFIFITLGILIGYTIGDIRYDHLKKYQPLEDMVNELSVKTYDWDYYNCLNFSEDGQKILKEKGIESTILVGDNGKSYNHAYLGVWFDAQTGDFVKGYKLVNIYK